MATMSIPMHQMYNNNQHVSTTDDTCRHKNLYATLPIIPHSQYEPNVRTQSQDTIELCSVSFASTRLGHWCRNESPIARRATLPCNALLTRKGGGRTENWWDTVVVALDFPSIREDFANIEDTPPLLCLKPVGCRYTIKIYLYMGVEKINTYGLNAKARFLILLTIVYDSTPCDPSHTWHTYGP